MKRRPVNAKYVAWVNYPNDDVRREPISVSRLRVVPVKDYGDEGCEPIDDRLCPLGDCACVGRSGDSVCGGYMGGDEGTVHCQEPLYEGELEEMEISPASRPLYMEEEARIQEQVDLLMPFLNSLSLVAPL